MASIKSLSPEQTQQQQRQLKSPQPSNIYNESEHKCAECSRYFNRCHCNRKMYNYGCLLLKALLLSVFMIVIFSLMNSNSNKYRLVKRRYSN